LGAVLLERAVNAMADNPSKAEQEWRSERQHRRKLSWEEAAKAEEVVRRRRFELMHRLTILKGDHKARFDPALMEGLDRTIEMCPMLGMSKQPSWKNMTAARESKKVCEAMIAVAKQWGFDASTSPERVLATINANIEHYEKFLGASDSPGKAWHYPARLIGEHVLKVLQSADKAAGNKVRVRYTTPILEFICEKLVPVCEQAGEEVPSTNALLKVLGEQP
jgi:hypothetical protein